MFLLKVCVCLVPAEKYKDTFFLFSTRYRSTIRSLVFALPISKVSSVGNDISEPKYYVTVGKKVVDVDGLLLSEGVQVEGYHLCCADVEKELESEPPKTTAATPAAATPFSHNQGLRLEQLRLQ